MRMLLLVGAPASGKTTLMRLALEDLGSAPDAELSFGTLRAQVYTQPRVLVLGVYDASTFAGTDRLPLNVQPVALAALETLAKDSRWRAFTVALEGDRLSNPSFVRAVRALPGVTLALVALTAPDDVLQARHQVRADKQSPSWRKGRDTKLARLLETYPPALTLPHASRADLRRARRAFGALLTAPPEEEEEEPERVEEERQQAEDGAPVALTP